MDGGEFHRLNDTSQGKIDEFGNFQTAEGVAMPTQSSGGLTKRNNADISELDIFSGEGAVISAYSESGFVINEEYTEGSVLMFPKRFWSWKPKTLDEITLEMLAPIWLHNPVPRTLSPSFSCRSMDVYLPLCSYFPKEILVLGTGPTLVRPPPELLKFLLVRGIATEVCATVRISYSMETLLPVRLVTDVPLAQCDLYVQLFGPRRASRRRCLPPRRSDP